MPWRLRAALAVTLVPVLMGYFIRGKVLPEHKNPLNRALIAVYMPALKAVLNYPKTTLVIAWCLRRRLLACEQKSVANLFRHWMKAT